MEYIYVGKISNTHGLNGELKILSEFKYKKELFTKNSKIYLGDNKIEYIIKSVRKTNNFDLLILDEVDTIELALKIKNQEIFADRSYFDNNTIFDEDLINMNVYSQKGFIGIVSYLLKGIKYDYLVVEKNKVKNMVPNINEFVKEIDLENKKIIIEEIEGLINEN